MGLSALSFAIMDVFIKYVSHFGGFQLVFFRSIASVSIGMSYLLYKGIPLLGVQRKLLVIRSLVGFTSMLLFFSAISLMPIGSAVSIRYLSPIFAAIFAIIVLREKVYRMQWLFFILAFISVLVLKGVDVRIGTLGLIMMIGSAFFSGWVYILIRAIGIRDHPVVIVNYFMTFCFIIGGFISIFQWKTPVGIEWPILLSLGIFGFAGQIFMTMALQIEEASRIAPFKYIEVIFVILIAYIWFGEGYNILSLAAIALIIFSLVMNVIYKRR
jgi:drug/metabolite transporter (DMT)-like permease